MYDRLLGAFFGAQFDPSDDTWSAIKVYRDGVPIILEAGFKTEDEAEAVASAERATEREANSQFGVGA